MDALSYPFIQQALLACIASGSVLSAVGVLVVLKRMIFLSVSLAQVATAGAAMALYLGFQPAGWQTPGVAVAATLAWALFLGLASGRSRIPDEALLAFTFALGGAGAILLLAKHAAGEAHMLTLIFGNVLFVTPWQNALLALLAAAGLAWLAVYHGRLQLAFYDPDFARSRGLSPRRLEVAFHLVVGLLVALSVVVIGVLLIFSFMVLPATAALLVLGRYRPTFAASAALALGASFAGVLLSFQLDLPTAATIVFLLCLVLLGALGARR